MTRPTRADLIRARREAFLLAQQWGCTPNEAVAELARRAAAERWEETKRKITAPLRVRTPEPESEPISEAPGFYWLRD